MRWLDGFEWLSRLVPAIVMPGLFAYAWRHRATPGAKPYCVLVAIASVAAFVATLSGLDRSINAVWPRMKQLLAVLIPLGTVFFTTQVFSDVMRTWRQLAALFIAGCLLGLYGQWGLGGTSAGGSLLLEDIGRATPAEVLSFLAIVVALVTTPIVVQATWQAPPGQRLQTAVIGAGLALPLVVLIAQGAMLDPQGPRVMAVALMLSLILTGWGLFYYEIVGVVPIARSTVVEHLSEGVIVLDTKNHVVDINPAAQRLLLRHGTSRQAEPDASGVTRGLTSGRLADVTFATWPWLRDACAWPVPARTSVLVEINGGSSTYDLSTSPLAGQDGRGIGRLIVLRDITDRMAAQAELLRQQGEVAALQERERLAREFHDGLAQDLTALSMKIGLWDDVEDPRIRAELDGLKSLVAGTIRDVRRAILDLRPLSLDEMGFFPALRQFTADFATSHDLEIEMRLVGDSGLMPARSEPVLFRCIQEALRNVARHARAGSASVRIDLTDPRCVTLTVQDDGTGFDTATLGSAVRGGHVGLTQIRERVEALAGSLSIRSQLGQGTEIIVTLPIDGGMRS